MIGEVVSNKHTKGHKHGLNKDGGNPIKIMITWASSFEASEFSCARTMPIINVGTVE